MGSIILHNSKYRALVRRKHPLTGLTISRSRLFDTRTEAKVWIRDEEYAIDNAPAVPPAATTIADLVDKALARTSGKAPGRSKHAALLAIKAAIGQHRIGEINAAVISSYVAARERDGAGPATIAMDLSFIGTLLRRTAALIDEGTAKAAQEALQRLSSVRAALLHARRLSRPQERARRPSEAEFGRLYDYLAARPSRVPVHTIMLFAVATGMRLGEICNLRWEDLDTSTKTVIIRDRKHPQRKMGNNQRVPLIAGPFKWRGNIIDSYSLAASQPKTHPTIFPYNHRTVGTLFQRAVRILKINDLHFHDLRHHAVSYMFEYGFGIEHVTLMTGHRDWHQLRRYTQIKPESLHSFIKN